jgi:hypothetical protein
MREVREGGKKLNQGEAMQIFLEELGVVGTKVGQVLAEHPDALPDDIRREISSLKDRARPFNKVGVFAYVEAADLTAETEDHPAIVMVEDLLGSASIKQVHLVRTDRNERLALKVARPAIDRNLQEDFAVFGHVLRRLEEEGYSLPPLLDSQIRKAVQREFDFGIEARAGEALDKSLRAREVKLVLADRAFPVQSAKIKILIERGSHRLPNLQFIAEECAPGLSVQEILDLQRLEREGTETMENKEKQEGILFSLRRWYGEEAERMREEYARLDVEALRAGLAIEILEEMAMGGVFHADLHAGNEKVDVGENGAVYLLDTGSAGNSEGRSLAFMDIATNLLLLKSGMANVETLSARLAEQVMLGTESIWQKVLSDLRERSETVGDVFTGVLGEMIRQNPEMNDDVRLFMKAIASAGGNFDALQRRLTAAIPAVMLEAGAAPQRFAEVFMKNYPELRRLILLLPMLPQIGKVLFASYFFHAFNFFPPSPKRGIQKAAVADFFWRFSSSLFSFCRRAAVDVQEHT